VPQALRHLFYDIGINSQDIFSLSFFKIFMNLAISILHHKGKALLELFCH